MVGVRTGLVNRRRLSCVVLCGFSHDGRAAQKTNAQSNCREISRDSQHSCFPSCRADPLIGTLNLKAGLNVVDRLMPRIVGLDFSTVGLVTVVVNRQRPHRSHQMLDRSTRRRSSTHNRLRARRSPHTIKAEHRTALHNAKPATTGQFLFEDFAQAVRDADAPPNWWVAQRRAEAFAAHLDELPQQFAPTGGLPDRGGGHRTSPDWS